MIVLEAEQGSVEWKRARLGIPTASQFGRIVTPARLAPSRQRHRYAAQLAAEWVMGEPVDVIADDYWIERGRALEPKARKAYSFLTDASVREVGFIYLDDDRMVGCSPDGLVGDDGGIELKCPAPATHLQWVAQDEMPSQHMAQVQGAMWVTGRPWWDFMSYCPEIEGMEAWRVRVPADEAWQAALDEHVLEFVAELLLMRESLVQRGVRPWTAPPPSVDDMYGGVPF